MEVLVKVTARRFILNYNFQAHSFAKNKGGGSNLAKSRLLPPLNKKGIKAYGDLRQTDR